ncbi:8-amino-7-oxononanoate synthase [Altererythrobacter sp. SALINAS58]|uniref:8-amino-7-oxononanoate synthase n=1 Tax=Alteripontixanthobacter muriae TaxID=2705546 RepID=UPI0015752CCD|nr:8-amino-7-oxononanoate synthase [Alteripontixanthobacter muriae]NTZ41552.1 8-amino-7-oxononanoate synthase [Alteripontixanthobacter muriae]
MIRPASDPLSGLRDDLGRLDAIGRRRHLRPTAGLDFSSNDYLALATGPRLREAALAALRDGAPTGSGGSRLLRGNHAAHEALETEAAAFFGSEAALYLSSGYAANIAVFAALPKPGDLIVHDALVHASAHDGMRLGRAGRVSARHNDVQAFADCVAAYRQAGNLGTVWIAVESLYSMDGDRAPLDDLMLLADSAGGVLVVDEAHATGVHGCGGRGLAHHLDGRANVVTLRTFGKALGCEGAIICGPQIVKDALVNRARPFIFSTAPSPLSAQIAGESLKILVEEPHRRADLHRLIAHASERLVPLGAKSSDSQIIPLIIGDDEAAMRTAEQLQEAGFDVRGIRPPTVPDGEARLRISITLNITAADIDSLAGTLEQIA